MMRWATGPPFRVRVSSERDMAGPCAGWFGADIAGETDEGQCESEPLCFRCDRGGASNVQRARGGSPPPLTPPHKGEGNPMVAIALPWKKKVRWSRVPLPLVGRG